MKNRNLSVNAYFRHLASLHTPKFRFSGKSKENWQKWHNALLPEVKKTLGKMPVKIPLNPEIIVEWKEDGLIKQKVIFDVDQHLSANAYVLRPENINGKIPGILACHGHCAFGKEPVMGNGSLPEFQAVIDRHNYDYGFQLAKAGYAVIAIDWRGFGDRDDRRKPNWNDNIRHRDICNVHYLRATIMGMTNLGMNIHDGMCALDYLCDQDFVDENSIGVIGESLGGTMATWMSIYDNRIKAADIVCYSDRFADFGMRDINFCGSQITPGLYELCDVPDLQGLIAPRPILVEIGTFDQCFKIESAMSCFHEVKKIYSAAGASENLVLDLFDGEHEWSSRKSFNFFKKHLCSE